MELFPRETSVSRPNQVLTHPLPIVHVHSAIVPIRVVEYVGQLAIGRQTGARINDARIQQRVALDIEAGGKTKYSRRLIDAGLVKKLITDKDIQHWVNDVSRRLFRQLDPSNVGSVEVGLGRRRTELETLTVVRGRRGRW